jgi:hypothetical protein
VICQKDKVVKGSRGHARTREPLTLNINKEGSSSLLKAAQIRGNEHVLLQISGQDTIAKEIRYHRSCYKDFTKADTLARLEEKNCESEDRRSQDYHDAFGEIQQRVQREVIGKNAVISISVLTSQFITELDNRGIHESNYRNSKMKQRLKKSFSNLISFRQPSRKNQPELVYYTYIDKGEFVEAVFTQSNADIGDMEETPSKDIDANGIYDASRSIRRLILDVETTMGWPPEAADLDDGTSIVPDLVYNMLCWILSSDCGFSENRIDTVSDNVHRLALSISQDLVHCVTRGRVKTPKHVALPLTVKSLTGNAEVITLLNRFGHGLSYSQILEIETALADKQIACQTDGVLLPSVCVPGIPGVFCWDNNDIQEETLSGKSTFMCQVET